MTRKLNDLTKPITLHPLDREYILSLLEKPELEDGCWKRGQRLTAKPKDSGFISIEGQSFVFTRMIWYLDHGPIPAGKFVVRSCRNSLCVNPAHMLLGDIKHTGRWASIIKARGRKAAKRKWDEEHEAPATGPNQAGEPVSEVKAHGKG